MQNEVALLSGETTVKRKLPLNFVQEHLPLFGADLERVIPETTLLEFRDVLISSDGILFNGYKMLPLSFAFPVNLSQWKLRSRMKFFINNYLLRRTTDFDSQILWVTDDWSKGYFHWLTDVLSRLYVVRNQLDRLILTLPHGYQDLEFVRSSLRCFGRTSVEFIRPNEVLRCKRIMMPSHTAPSGHYNEHIIRGVRNVVLSAYGDRSEHKNDRIYISRGKAVKRRITNEPAVVDILSDYGFQTIYAEDLSFEQQVNTFSRAQCILSNHGAGLTNILFAPEGANVLELRHHDDRINNCYFTLASALNLRYFYQTCQAVSLDADPHMADLVVDMNALEQNLRLFLS